MKAKVTERELEEALHYPYLTAGSGGRLQRSHRGNVNYYIPATTNTMLIAFTEAFVPQRLGCASVFSVPQFFYGSVDQLVKSTGVKTRTI